MSRMPTAIAACADWSHELQLAADRELDGPEAAALESHLSACGSCRSALDDARALRHRLQHAAHCAAPSGLADRLRQALNACDAGQLPAAAPGGVDDTAEAAGLPPLSTTHRPSAPSIQVDRVAPRRWARPVAISTAAVAACAVWALWPMRGPDLTRELVARHARPLPLELQSDDPRVLEQWLADKVGFRVHVPHPGRGNLALIGTRLSNVRDRPAVFVQYGDGRSPTRRVSLVVYDDPVGDMPVPGEPHPVLGPRVVTTRAAGYRVAAWRQDQLVYSLVADDDADAEDLVESTVP